MKRTLLALAAATLLSSSAFATKIGVSMDKFDDNFLTVLRNGMADYAKTLPGVTVQIEDAKDDVSKQLSQVQNFIANGVSTPLSSIPSTLRLPRPSPGPPLMRASHSSTSIASRVTSTAPRPPL
jgi:inositol transport system substrate-binding protein